GPETHRIFGHALARQIADCWDRLGRPAPFVVREEGAGSGTLARDILGGLWNERPESLPAMRYELNDVNAARVAEGVERLGADGIAQVAVASTEETITGVLLANELLDAFPVHRLVVRDDGLREVYVTWRDGWFTDDEGSISSNDLTAPVDGLVLSDGQRLEVSPAAWGWARSIGSSLQRGYAILIDYGFPAGELYSPVRFPDGSLRTYSGHLVGDDPYRRVGRQDLTTHVDFTAISRAAEAGGCRVLGLTSQAHFFAGLGIEELLLDLQQSSTDLPDYLNARETIMHLLDPRALGRFRVLVLGKSVSDNPPLRGLSFALR
ncbi:MAG: class I SAM-dependent methyltransferase, partial [Vicinamibacterales bacterium]